MAKTFNELAKKIIAHKNTVRITGESKIANIEVDTPKKYDNGKLVRPGH